MNHSDFPEANKTLLAPPGSKNTTDLRVYNDGEVSLSCWQPTPEELAEINRTGVVWVMVVAGETSPPIAVLGHYPFVPNEACSHVPLEQRSVVQQWLQAQRNYEPLRIVTNEAEAMEGLDIGGYLGKWKQAMRTAMRGDTSDDAVFWTKVRRTFLELGGEYKLPDTLPTQADVDAFAERFEQAAIINPEQQEPEAGQ